VPQSTGNRNGTGTRDRIGWKVSTGPGLAGAVIAYARISTCLANESATNASDATSTQAAEAAGMCDGGIGSTRKKAQSMSAFVAVSKST
jgi:hypothetical protein